MSIIKSTFPVDELPEDVQEEMKNEVKMNLQLDGVELTIKEDGCQLDPVFVNFMEALRMNAEQFERKYGKLVAFQYYSVKHMAIMVIGGLVERAKLELKEAKWSLS